MSFKRTQIVPIPFKHERKLIAPVIKNKHIWENEKYIKLFSDAELKNCIEYEKKLICENTEPLQLKRDANTCEWQLYVNTTASDCEYEEHNGEESWTWLHNNQWIYSISNESSVNIKSEYDEFNIKLNGTGRLKINKNCEVTTSRFRLNVMNEVTSSNEIKFHAQIHEIQWPAKTNIGIFKEKLRKTIKKLENADDRLFLHHLHHYVAIYAITITVMCIVWYFYSKLELAPMP